MSSDDPIEDVYSYVERAYIRLQAGDILIRCLEDNSTLPIQLMVEGLILAGPHSLNELRQVLAETSTRRLQVEDDLWRVYIDMKRIMGDQGLIFPERGDYHYVLALTPLELLVLMTKQGIEDNIQQSACLRVFQDGHELMLNLNNNLRLLAEIEMYIMDWSWGLAYELARQPRKKSIVEL